MGQVLGDLGRLLGERVDDPVELGVHGAPSCFAFPVAEPVPLPAV
jgi:hypothetical protein